MVVKPNVDFVNSALQTFVRGGFHTDKDFIADK